MKQNLTRREFLRRAALTAAGLWAALYVTSGLRAAYAPNELLAE